MIDATRKEPDGFEHWIWTQNIGAVFGEPNRGHYIAAEVLARKAWDTAWAARGEHDARIAEEYADLPNASVSYNLSVVAGTAARIAEKIRSGK